VTSSVGTRARSASPIQKSANTTAAHSPTTTVHTEKEANRSTGKKHRRAWATMKDYGSLVAMRCVGFEEPSYKQDGPCGCKRRRGVVGVLTRGRRQRPVYFALEACVCL
jgi:hypothetical protein